MLMIFYSAYLQNIAGKQNIFLTPSLFLLCADFFQPCQPKLFWAEFTFRMIYPVAHPAYRHSGLGIKQQEISTHTPIGPKFIFDSRVRGACCEQE